MGIFDSLGAQASSGAPQRMNPMQMLQQLRRDPAGMLKQAGLNVPAGMSDPRQITEYLLQSGQVPSARYQQVMQMAGRMGRK